MIIEYLSSGIFTFFILLPNIFCTLWNYCNAILGFNRVHPPTLMQFNKCYNDFTIDFHNGAIASWSHIDLNLGFIHRCLPSQSYVVKLHCITWDGQHRHIPLQFHNIYLHRYFYFKDELFIGFLNSLSRPVCLCYYLIKMIYKTNHVDFKTLWYVCILYLKS